MRVMQVEGLLLSRAGCGKLHFRVRRAIEVRLKHARQHTLSTELWFDWSFGRFGFLLLPERAAGVSKMSGRYAFAKGLKEVRFLFCQTGEHSAATR